MLMTIKNGYLQFSSFLTLSLSSLWKSSHKSLVHSEYKHIQGFAEQLEVDGQKFYFFLFAVFVTLYLPIVSCSFMYLFRSMSNIMPGLINCKLLLLRPQYMERNAHLVIVAAESFHGRNSKVLVSFQCNNHCREAITLRQ